MIALDASTAIQPFRDGTYDIAEFGEKLQALLENGSGYVVFKYADGSVVSIPSAALVEAMVPYFSHLLVGGSVVLELGDMFWGDYTLVIRSTNGDGALEAQIPTHEAGSATAQGSHIVKLIVSGAFSVKDLSAWAAAHSLAGKPLYADRVSGVSRATATTSSASSVYVSGGATLQKATFAGEWDASPISAATGLVSPSTVGFYDDATRGTVEIALNSSSMMLSVPSRDANTVTTTIRCEIPYHTAAGWEYLEVDSYTVDRGDSPHTEAAKGAMAKFLLWPRWKMEGSSVTERTFRVYPGGPMTGEAPIIRVRNNTDGTLSLPRVWSFTKAGGKGAVAVAATATLPPYSCKEFEFRHSEAANCGYMCPLSVW